MAWQVKPAILDGSCAEYGTTQYNNLLFVTEQKGDRECFIQAREAIFVLHSFLRLSTALNEEKTLQRLSYGIRGREWKINTVGQQIFG